LDSQGQILHLLKNSLVVLEFWSYSSSWYSTF